jgi:hypothetical protein
LTFSKIYAIIKKERSVSMLDTQKLSLPKLETSEERVEFL